MSELDFDIRPVAGRIGAVITGVDLAGELDDRTVDRIRAALLAHRVVFFREQELDSDALVAFGTRFGNVTNGHPTIPGPDHNPIVQDIQYPPGGARAEPMAQRRDVRAAPTPGLDPPRDRDTPLRW